MNSLKISTNDIPGTQPQKNNENGQEIKPQTFPPDYPATSPGHEQDNDSEKENQQPKTDPGRSKIYFTHKAEIAYFTQVPLQTDKKENI
jgi:hypothetical protein